MHKRGQISLAVLLVTIVAGIVWHGLQERGPVYQGKPLRVWLREYYNWNAYVGSEGRNAAAAAIRQIGTNAIPTLLNMLRKKNSPLVSKLIPLWDRYVTRTSYLPFWVAYPSWYQVHANRPRSRRRSVCEVTMRKRVTIALGATYPKRR